SVKSRTKLIVFRTSVPARMIRVTRCQGKARGWAAADHGCYIPIRIPHVWQSGLTLNLQNVLATTTVVIHVRSVKGWSITSVIRQTILRILPDCRVAGT